MNQKGTLIAHTVALTIIFFGSIWAFIHYESLPLMQFYVVIAAVLVYVTLGIVYQILNKRLTFKLVLEYFLIGALGILLFSWTLFS